MRNVQEYSVKAEAIDNVITVAVTQDGESAIGVGSALRIDEAFDLAHADFVSQISEEEKKRLLDSVTESA